MVLEAAAVVVGVEDRRRAHSGPLSIAPTTNLNQLSPRTSRCAVASPARNHHGEVRKHAAYAGTTGISDPSASGGPSIHF